MTVGTSGAVAEAMARRIEATPLERGLRVARSYGIVIAVAALVVVLSISSPNFLTVENLRNILDQNAYLALTAFGATLVIIAGGFDLSVGAIFALTGVLGAWVAVNVDPLLGLLAGLGVGAAAGLVNGALTTVLRVHSFLITLAVGIVLTGIAVSVSGGFLIDASALSAFTWLGQTRIAGVPPSIVLFALAAAALSFVLARTTYGRQVYAVGGNPKAARLAGVPVNRVVVTTFVLSGVMAAMAGLLEVSRTGTGQADPGGAKSLALDAIAAVIVGGTSIRGGKGAIWRTVFGVLLIALMHNGFNLLNVAPHWRDIATGLVIVAAVAVNASSEGQK